MCARICRGLRSTPHSHAVPWSRGASPRPISASEGRSLAHLADVAERADRGHREAAENALSAALAKIDTDRLRSPLVAELADAEARVLIARRFHNDAVRDTLALRTRRTVQWLHLGGTAPLPTYFEIAERAGTSVPVSAQAVAVRPTPSPSTPSSPTPSSPAPVPDRARTSARVVLLDDEGRVLLLRGHDPTTPEAPFLVHGGWSRRTGGEPAGCGDPGDRRGNGTSRRSGSGVRAHVAARGGLPVQR